MSEKEIIAILDKAEETGKIELKEFVKVVGVTIGDLMDRVDALEKRVVAIQRDGRS